MVYIHEYDNDHQIIGTHGVGLGGLTNTEWMDFETITHYDNTKYVKLEVGLWYDLDGEPNPLNEIRFDDVNFSIWTLLNHSNYHRRNTRESVHFV